MSNAYANGLTTNNNNNNNSNNHNHIGNDGINATSTPTRAISITKKRNVRIANHVSFGMEQNQSYQQQQDQQPEDFNNRISPITIEEASHVSSPEIAVMREWWSLQPPTI